MSGQTAFSDIEEIKKNPDRLSVLVAQPIASTVSFRCHDNGVEFMAHLARKEKEGTYKFYTGTVGRLFPSYARELIAEKALQAKVDYILWIDADMIVPADLFDRLVAHNVDIVCPLAFMRVPPFDPVLFKITEQNGVVVKAETVHDFEIGKLNVVDSIGFGCVLMKTKVLEAVPRPWFMGMSGLGEDIQFAWKLTQAGIPVYADCSFNVGHEGDPPIITYMEYKRWREEKHLQTTYMAPMWELSDIQQWMSLSPPSTTPANSRPALPDCLDSPKPPSPSA